MNQLVYFLVFLLLAPLLFSFWVAGLDYLAPVIFSPELAWFGLGLLAALLIGLLLGGAGVGFIEAAMHELIHAFVGFLFLGQIKYIEAKSKGGGHTEIEGNGGCNPFVPFFLLAPYCFPLLTIPFLAAKPVVIALGAAANHAVDVAIGFTLGFHYVMHIKQFSFEQSDLRKVGPVVAVGITYTLILVFLVIIIAIVLGQYRSILDFFSGAIARAPEYYRAALAWLQNAWGALRPQLGL